MLAGLRPSELGMWWALWRRDPWGEQRDDLRTGIVASLIANVNRDPKRRSAPFKPEEFMPYFERPDQEEASQDLSRRIRAALKNAGQKP